MRSQSLYLHFPFCRHFCNYCDFYKHNDQASPSDLLQYHSDLTEMMKLHRGLYEENGFTLDKLKTLFIGGGTPSLWGRKGSEFLKTFFQDSSIEFQDDYEFTIEVNPGTWTESDIEHWKGIGVNRFSVGIQTLNSHCLKALDRIHSVDEAHQTLFTLMKAKSNFSVDLMLGIPRSLEYNRSILDEINKLTEYSPSHFSVYILTVPQTYKFYDELPSEEIVQEEYLKTADYLKSLGFDHYEVSNYALPGKQSLHNSAYWNSESVAALGPSATGFINRGDGSGLRYKWKNRSVGFDLEELSPKQLKLEKTYLALRTNKGVPVESLCGQDSLETVSKLATKWRNFGYLDRFDDNLALSSKGFLMMDSLLQDMFRHTNLFDSL
jgi:oxygen-independent coproporphyrinogen-3 oxidase